MKKKKSFISFKNIKMFVMIAGFIVTGVTVAVGAYAASMMVKYDRMITKVDKAAEMYIKKNEKVDNSAE